VIDGDFILVDASAEFRGYASDNTRTYPVNGIFSDTQKEIYEVVEEIVAEIEILMRPGMSWQAFQTRAQHTVCRSLFELGYLQGNLDELIQNEMWYYFYPHNLGHSVGLDVHDPGFTSGILQENMVITVEPGIYFNRAFVTMALNDPITRPFIVVDKVLAMLDANFGGVRIEDTVVVTNNGIDSITTVPKTVADIEELMNQ